MPADTVFRLRFLFFEILESMTLLRSVWIIGAHRHAPSGCEGPTKGYNCRAHARLKGFYSWRLR
ncbi:hypothetical protein PSEUDO9AG_50208 [Pseudomonas sp. 9Ag]|jgi:hypothetical protein|nr:hypothetical protein PSEUDO9AG_50208 [Pseudomonas sp. 9Ag]